MVNLIDIKRFLFNSLDNFEPGVYGASDHFLGDNLLATIALPRLSSSGGNGRVDRMGQNESRIIAAIVRYVN